MVFVGLSFLLHFISFCFLLYFAFVYFFVFEQLWFDFFDVLVQISES